jgi:hypothetical protein
VLCTWGNLRERLPHIDSDNSAPGNRQTCRRCSNAHHIVVSVAQPWVNEAPGTIFSFTVQRQKSARRMMTGIGHHGKAAAAAIGPFKAPLHDDACSKISNLSDAPSAIFIHRVTSYLDQYYK